MFVAIGVGSCDHFGNRHPIPPNIEYEIPTSNAYSHSNFVHPIHDGFICYQDTDAITLDVDSIPTFHVYEAGQPGFYIYIATLQNAPSGTLYLKAYEISSGINIEPLKSEYQIVSFMGIQSFCKGFKIETGSWGEPYAARIELWFSHAEENNEDIKLAEKVYRVEGWSR